MSGVTLPHEIAVRFLRHEDTFEDRTVLKNQLAGKKQPDPEPEEFITLRLSRPSAVRLEQHLTSAFGEGRLVNEIRAAFQPDPEEGREPEDDSLAARIKAELRSDETGALAGPLGEAIATAAGNYSLEFVTPEQIAEGFRVWLAPKCEGCGKEVGEDRGPYPPDGIYLCESCELPVTPADSNPKRGGADG